MNYSDSKLRRKFPQLLWSSQISKNKDKDNSRFILRIAMSMMTQKTTTIQKVNDFNNMSK